MYRKDPLVTGAVYHVMNKSIAGYEIFPQQADYDRMVQLFRYFTLAQPPTKFSFFRDRDSIVLELGFEHTVAQLKQETGATVSIIAFCLMPTHFHLVVKQLQENGISEFLRKALNGYARYFNTKYKRQGTLWMSRFKNVRVKNDEQLLHLSRYIHLNPVTANIVTSPEQWEYSSYTEYIEPEKRAYPVTEHKQLIPIESKEYQEFCNDHRAY